MPTGYVFYMRQGALVARRLDLPSGTLVGDAMTVADPVGRDGALGVGAFSVSASGIVAYRSGGPGAGSWSGSTAPVDRSGPLATQMRIVSSTPSCLTTASGWRSTGRRRTIGTCTCSISPAADYRRLTFDAEHRCGSRLVSGWQPDRLSVQPQRACTTYT